MNMMCFQCQETSHGTGCTTVGICGKDPQVAALQDLLVHALKGISMHAHRAAELERHDAQVDRFVITGLFSTVTNVDFDVSRLEVTLREASEVLQRAKALSGAGDMGGPDTWTPAPDLQGLIEQGHEVGIATRREGADADVASMQEMIVYGLKGAAAYADHARVLGSEDPEVYQGFHAALNVLTIPAPKLETLVHWAMKVGELNLKVMALLDGANTTAYGHPEPTQVRMTPVTGKCILVSGHDLKDLELLLEQTQGRGIKIYTHSEMLPALAYPGLKRFEHLVGNYGGAWQNQGRDFEDFPGAILMTTNCIQKPRKTYKARIFTTGHVAWPEVTHIPSREDGHKDFSPVIEAALAADGFTADSPERTTTIGFARNAVLGAADKVVEAVKAGDIRRFFLVGGCDGHQSSRDYYRDLVASIPQDCMVLTLACGKYRFNDLAMGDIGGIPRLLDMGQCNDAYSAIQVASALANAFSCDINELPLSLVLSWYEQKAVAILLTLLHLGVKNIRLGPSLPAFVTPNVLRYLVDNFNIQPITTAQDDLAAMLA